MRRASSSEQKPEEIDEKLRRRLVELILKKNVVEPVLTCVRMYMFYLLKRPRIAIVIATVRLFRFDRDD